MSQQGWGGYYDEQAMGDLWDSGGYSDEYRPRTLPGGPGTVTNAPSGLRLREGPSTSDGTILVMPNGAYVDVLDDLGNGWYYVSYQGTEGYASAQYVTIGEGRRGSSPAPTPPFDPPVPPAPDVRPSPAPPEPSPEPAKKSNTLAIVGGVAALALGYFFLG
jgi:SH3 domain-containing protein